MREYVAQPLARRLGTARYGGNLLLTQHDMAVQGRQKHGALVFEGLVDTAGGQSHGVDQVADRGRVVTLFTKHADRLIERFVHVKLARPPAGAHEFYGFSGRPAHGLHIGIDHSLNQITLAWAAAWVRAALPGCKTWPPRHIAADEQRHRRSNQPEGRARGAAALSRPSGTAARALSPGGSRRAQRLRTARNGAVPRHFPWRRQATGQDPDQDLRLVRGNHPCP